MDFDQSQQFFSQSQLSGSQTQQAQSLRPRSPDLRHLASLSPAERDAIYRNILLDSKAIQILPNGSLFSKGLMINIIQLTQPLHPGDTLAHEAAQVFYAQNEFVVSITTIADFINWTMGNFFKPSDMITRLAILYGPPTNPGGGNGELKPLLFMPNLHSLRLIFQDYPYPQSKSLGPYAYLSPSFRDIILLKARQGLNLRLQLKNGSVGLEGKPEDIDADDVELQDITIFLQPPSVEEQRIIAETREICRRYKGCAASNVTVLVESGWSWKDSERVVFELWSRAAVQDWIEKERLNNLEAQDVEMS